MYLSQQSTLFPTYAFASSVVGAYLTYTYLISLFANAIRTYLKSIYLSMGISITLCCCGIVLLFTTLAYPTMIYIVLALLATGLGLFRVHITDMYRSIYTGQQTTLRPVGLSLSYTFSVLSRALAIPIIGFSAKYLGWHVAFSILSISMFGCFVCFIVARRSLCNPIVKATQGRLTNQRLLLVIGLILAIVIIVCLLISHWFLQSIVLGCMLVALISLLAIIYKGFNRYGRKRLRQLYLLILFVVYAWALNLQLYMSIPVIVKEHFNLYFLGITWSPSSVLAWYFLMLTLVSPIFAYIIQHNKITRFAQSSHHQKIGIAILFIGLGFTLLGILLLHATRDINLGYLLIFQALLVISELIIIPYGISLVIKLSPSGTSSLMLSIVIAIFAYAGFLGGMLSRYILIDIKLNTAYASMLFIIFGGVALLLAWGLFHFKDHA
ncbi:hypothetical protein [Cysteiniphilum marinum]|uniref:hypothetical protein n=1 Tax=Cysteiniphilum marinum TaxID=2774191 RepID=UPI00193C0207|nr:hypothetical protein [Cysteiniphilum marinum]